MAAETWRLFIAADPSPPVRAGLESLQSELKREHPAASARWSRPDDLHCTLFFFGPVDSARVPEITEASARTAGAFTRFAMEARGIGGFPHPDAARVIWAGVPEAPSLFELRSALAKAYGDLGYPDEKREFHPHITLARPRNPVSIREAADRRRNLSLGTTEVTELILYRSIPTPEKSRYEVVARFELR